MGSVVFIPCTRLYRPLWKKVKTISARQIIRGLPEHMPRQSEIVRSRCRSRIFLSRVGNVSSHISNNVGRTARRRSSLTLSFSRSDRSRRVGRRRASDCSPGPPIRHVGRRAADRRRDRRYDPCGKTVGRLTNGSPPMTTRSRCITYRRCRDSGRS